MDFLAVLAIGVLVLTAVGVAGYFILRRVFERAADRVADHIGQTLADLAGRAIGPRQRGRSAASPAKPARLTRLGAYARAEGLSEDAARREFADSIERIARLMDAAVRVPVVGPVGLDAVLGVFPVAGDVISGSIAVLLIAKSLKYGVPHDVIARMLANVLFDVIIGAVPVAGDLADIWFRANTRNVAILRDYLELEASDIIDVRAERVS
jgi:Domain of unknown function (DUF4112)